MDGRTSDGRTGDAQWRYEAMVEAGEVAADAAQRHIAQRLSQLQEELENRRFATKGSALGWLFARRERENPLKGIYIHGAVGRGKTMLMDLFYQGAPDLPKRRVHFHEFMADVHERIHAFRKADMGDDGKGRDPIGPVADAIADEARLLCFDEFHVRDITDAMILGRLFAGLFRHKVIVVATSNDAPQELYGEGLNRALFLPFIDLLQQRLDVLHLDARGDYRLDKLAGQPVYFLPPGDKARAAMDGLWRRLTGGAPARAVDLALKGRAVRVPQAAMGNARFSFADLCEAPLGTQDYLKIARTYHTVFVDDIPVLGENRRNEARRFIHLVDTLYDAHVKLVVSAAAEPAALYPQGDGADLFVRTASRLIDMRSHDYLAAAHGRARSAAAAIGT